MKITKTRSVHLLERPGGIHRGTRGRFEGDLRSAILISGFGSDTPAHVYDMGGGSLCTFRRAHLRAMKIEE